MWNITGAFQKNSFHSAHKLFYVKLDLSGPILHLLKDENHLNERTPLQTASQETLCPRDLVDQGRKENQLPVVEEKVKEMGDRHSK